MTTAPQYGLVIANSIHTHHRPKKKDHKPRKKVYLRYIRTIWVYKYAELYKWRQSHFEELLYLCSQALDRLNIQPYILSLGLSLVPALRKELGHRIGEIKCMGNGSADGQYTHNPWVLYDAIGIHSHTSADWTRCTLAVVGDKHNTVGTQCDARFVSGDYICSPIVWCVLRAHGSYQCQPVVQGNHVCTPTKMINLNLFQTNRLLLN